MTGIPLLVLTLVLAACGSSTGETGVPASSGPESGPAETVSGPSTSIDESKLKPPEILLRSGAGEQKAVEGSFCVDYVDPSSGVGSGVCGDSGAVHPDAVTVVQPGDNVTFALSGAAIVRSNGCHSDDEQGCIGYVLVRPLGCEDAEIDRVPLALGPKTRWAIDLEKGAYELDIFGYFERSDGATGDVSGSLGLLVGGGPKEDDYRGVVALELAMQVCPFGP